MPRGAKFKPEEIIAKLREDEVELARGKKVPEICKQIGVTEQTYYRWKKEFGGLADGSGEASEGDWRKGNARLKRLLTDADLDLDKAILKESSSGNF
jgi:putative transposase